MSSLFRNIKLQQIYYTLIIYIASTTLFARGYVHYRKRKRKNFFLFKNYFHT